MLQYVIFQLSILQTILKNCITVSKKRKKEITWLSTLMIKIIVSWASNHHIRMKSEGSFEDCSNDAENY